MDPLQVTLGALAGRAASRVLNTFLGPEGSALAPMLPVVESSSISIEDEAGQALAVVTEGQYREITQFLQTREVASLLQSYCVLKVAGKHYDDLSETLSAIRDAFCGRAEEAIRHRTESWASIAPDLWGLITRSIDAVAPTARDIALESEDLSELLARFTSESELLRGRRPSAPRHIRELADLMGDPSRLAACRNAIADIRRAAKEAYRELVLTHAHDEYRVNVDRLYVDRTLKAHHGEASIDSSALLSIDGGRIPRGVVIGDPGAGKTTLVQHLAYVVTNEGEWEVAPIVLHCRKYAATSWGISLTRYIVDVLDVESSIKIDEAVFIDVLTTGGAYLIFDGVDEIIDLSRRRAFIRQIEAFGRRFPFVSIVATARRVGYARAKFSDKTLRVFELDEFSDQQFYEYVQKWFGITKRDSTEMHSFIRESSSIQDIRRNPLMLSLLCALYRAKGFIPRNRRQIYRECSDLLFQRWDAMRHIEQPFDHRQYGQRLMQELARFFYQSQSAQGGLEEQQLVKLIAIFFRDTASIDPPEDQNRAQLFVDFCADRAWLLSAKGYNSRGNRLFAFTHRTFMEYYAAECMVRLAQGIDDIAGTIVNAFAADPSSVVPDVMVQAADDKFDRGAELVLKRLLQGVGGAATYHDKYLALCLRIVNSAPMSRAVSNSLAERIRDSWKDQAVDATIDSATALFELYRDPRAKIVQYALSEIVSGYPTEWGLAEGIAKRWARFEALRVAQFFEREWFEALSPVLDGIAKRYVYSASSDPTLVDYLIATDRISPTSFSMQRGRELLPRLHVPAFSTAAPGCLIDGLIDALVHGTANIDRSYVGAMEWHMRTAARVAISIKSAEIVSSVLCDSIVGLPVLNSQQVSARLGVKGAVRDFALWIMCLMYEISTPNLIDAHERFDGVVGLEPLRRLFVTRNRIRARSRRTRSNVRSFRPEEVRELLVDFGRWATEWASGDLSLTFDSHEFDASSMLPLR